MNASMTDHERTRPVALRTNKLAMGILLFRSFTVPQACPEAEPKDLSLRGACLYCLTQKPAESYSEVTAFSTAQAAVSGGQISKSSKVNLMSARNFRSCSCQALQRPPAMSPVHT